MKRVGLGKTRSSITCSGISALELLVALAISTVSIAALLRCIPIFQQLKERSLLNKVLVQAQLQDELELIIGAQVGAVRPHAHIKSTDWLIGSIEQLDASEFSDISAPAPQGHVLVANTIDPSWRNRTIRAAPTLSAEGYIQLLETAHLQAPYKAIGCSVDDVCIELCCREFKCIPLSHPLLIGEHVDQSPLDPALIEHVQPTRPTLALYLSRHKTLRRMSIDCTRVVENQPIIDNINSFETRILNNPDDSTIIGALSARVTISKNAATGEVEQSIVAFAAQRYLPSGIALPLLSAAPMQ